MTVRDSRQRPSEITVFVWKSDGKLISEQLINSEMKRLDTGLINQYSSDNASMFAKKKKPLQLTVGKATDRTPNGYSTT